MEQNNKKPVQKDVQKPASRIENILGSILWIMMHSPAHKHLFVADYEWLVMPAVSGKQFRIFKKNNMPAGYVSWAYVSEEVEARILKGSSKIAPGEWRSGDRIWIIDFIAPFGGGKELLKDLNEKVFKDKHVKMLEPKKNSKGFQASLLKEILNRKENGNSPKK